MQADAVLIVPCHNEGLRFDEAGLLSLLSEPSLRLLLVDDGSTDSTSSLISRFLAKSSGRASSMRFEQNRGKGEAVRQGFQAALESGAGVVGYLDADLSTPPSEMLRLLAVLRSGPSSALLGSRVALLGKRIERHPLRHYLGRTFATYASTVLSVQIYDSQCGAKWFRRSPALEAATAEPFVSRWIFDVELLGRVLILDPEMASQLFEEPLLAWRDVPGSKLFRVRNLPEIALEMVRVASDLARRRQARYRAGATTS